MSHEVELYVAPDKRVPARLCLGSLLCTNFLQYLPEGMIKVVNASSTTPPLFCKGTPCLYELRTKNVYAGFDAYEYMLNLVVAYAKRSNATSRTKEGHVNAKKATMREHSSPLVSHGTVRSAPIMTPKIQLNERPSRIQHNTQENNTDSAGDFWEESSSPSNLEDSPEPSSNKLNEDDFQRMVNSRSSAIQQTQQAQGAQSSSAPALPPLDD
jgi:hypothetical protein